MNPFTRVREAFKDRAQTDTGSGRAQRSPMTLEQARMLYPSDPAYLQHLPTCDGDKDYCDPCDHNRGAEYDREDDRQEARRILEQHDRAFLAGADEARRQAAEASHQAKLSRSTRHVEALRANTLVDDTGQPTVDLRDELADSDEYFAGEPRDSHWDAEQLAATMPMDEAREIVAGRIARFAGLERAEDHGDGRFSASRMREQAIRHRAALKLVDGELQEARWRAAQAAEQANQHETSDESKNADVESDEHNSLDEQRADQTDAEHGEAISDAAGDSGDSGDSRVDSRVDSGDGDGLAGGYVGPDLRSSREKFAELDQGLGEVDQDSTGSGTERNARPAHHTSGGADGHGVAMGFGFVPRTPPSQTMVPYSLESRADSVAESLRRARKSTNSLHAQRSAGQRQDAERARDDQLSVWRSNTHTEEEHRSAGWE